MCDLEKIKEEKTTADSPQFNGVAERALWVVKVAILAAKIQVFALYPDESIPNGDHFWAEQAYWACHALNRTATSANPKFKTPHEMWHGSPLDGDLFPFLKQGLCRRKRTKKLRPKAGKMVVLEPRTRLAT